MKTLILAAFVSLSLGAMGGRALADAQQYHAPAHNYYQNNWMSDG